MTLRLDAALEKELEKERKVLHLTRSEVVRRAIQDFLRRQERQRFMDALVKAAKHRDPEEDRAMAEEGLEWGDRALSAAENVWEPLPTKTSRSRGRKQ